MLNSKKLVATILGAVLIAVLSGLNKRFSLGVESTDIMSLAGLIAAYVASQAWADGKTEGATSGVVQAALAAKAAAPEVKP